MPLSAIFLGGGTTITAERVLTSVLQSGPTSSKSQNVVLMPGEVEAEMRRNRARLARCGFKLTRMLDRDTSDYLAMEAVDFGPTSTNFGPEMTNIGICLSEFGPIWINLQPMPTTSARFRRVQNATLGIFLSAERQAESVTSVVE